MSKTPTRPGVKCLLALLLCLTACPAADGDCRDAILRHDEKTGYEKRACFHPKQILVHEDQVWLCRCPHDEQAVAEKDGVPAP